MLLTRLPTLKIPPSTPWGEELESSLFRWSQQIADAINSLFFPRLVTVTASQEVNHRQGIYLCDATSGAITMTLPAAKDARNAMIVFKKIDVSANAVTIDGSGSETIDGSTTLVLSTQYQSEIIGSNGSAWYVFARRGIS